MIKIGLAKLGCVRGSLAVSLSVVLVSSAFAQETAEPPKPTPETSAAAPEKTKLDPWANTTNATPPPSVYSGPLFELSHSYPAMSPALPVDPPWIQALGKKP